MASPVYFADAIKLACRIVADPQVPPSVGILVVRNLLGRISFAVRTRDAEVVSKLNAFADRLGSYAGSPFVITEDDLFDPEAIFNDPAIVEIEPPGERRVKILDRQVTGHEWLQLPSPSPSGTVPRLVFFGLKGGVGRSTAIAVLAYLLAKSGKSTLLIDLDLESPGLSGLLLPPDKLPDFGVVDWLVEDAIGQAEDLVPRMVTSSPLAQDLRQDIRVAPAMGGGDWSYLDKLSRVYGDVSFGGGVQRFSERVDRLVRNLERTERPDVVLIDSRAGLHDLAAISIVGLASTAFLFATDSAQAWRGYESLFSHWLSRPKVAKDVRERLKIVRAMFPESDQVASTRRFLERSYSLFAGTLYQEIEAGASARDNEAFNFDLADESAPHYPLLIKWSARFQEFDPLQIPYGLFSDDEIRAAFGGFVDGVLESIGVS